MINAIENIQSITVAAGTTSLHDVTPANAGFLEQLNQSVSASTQMLSDVAAGKSMPTHELMLNLELAKQQLQLAIEVRNKLVDAYQELMRMQM